MSKKLLFILIILALKFAPAKAQCLTIPDANFVNYLTQNYPSCMIGNQMDTMCTQIVTEDSVIVSFLNIASITGIEYFNNLNTLKCNNNQLTSLPQLPSTLTYLNCNDNQLTSLPQLPNNLNWLECNLNQLTSLPTLPNNLNLLNCNINQITSIPVLPSALISLFCTNNQLTSIPQLPNNLVQLNCDWNQLINLPSLPSTLQTLSFQTNQLTSLPALSSNLYYLFCGGNQLTSLPALPNSLTYLECGNNQLTSLPALPSSLTYLECGNNQLTSLPFLPSNLNSLICGSNQLISLPLVPNVMQFFIVTNNSFSCLTNLPLVSNDSYGNIENNPLTCVPNQTNYSLGLPLCVNDDPINNPNNCVGVNITGYVYTDLNNNCTFNNSDVGTSNVPVKLLDSLNNLLAQSYTHNGIYSFNSLLWGIYKVKFENSILPIVLTCGQANNQTVTLNSANQTIMDVNFPLLCEGGYDINVQSVNAQGLVFPWQIHHLFTNITNNQSWYNLVCDSSLSSGTVSIQLDGLVTYISPELDALTPQVSGNIFTYTINDFNTLTPNSFGLKLFTDTTAQAGDQICVHVEILPTPVDINTTNNVYNFCYNVFNSYDPNMKEVYPVNVLPSYEDWFTYTIHFQNTGNAPAFNIRLRDTLDLQLGLNSFEVLGYSHAATTTLSGNILTVRFNNIMLPDSTSDYEGSMGYFQHKIKPLSNMLIGSQISNTAYIYFDYNAPIITNTTQNNFEFTVNTQNIIVKENGFDIYPNPSSGIFIFEDSKNIKTVEVFNLLG